MVVHEITIRDAGFAYRNMLRWSPIEGWHLRWTPYGMPRIASTLADAVFFLFGRDPHADSEEKIDGPLGSGVIVGMWDYAGRKRFTHYYGVTAAHVARTGASIIAVNTKDGRRRLIDLDPSEWTANLELTDLAIVDITDRLNYQTDAFSYIPRDLFADERFLDDAAVTEGEDGFMLGLFAEHSGTVRNLIAARFGNVSMLADSSAPIEWDVPDLGVSFSSPCHVFDMHSRPGFSGSPVFIYRTPDGDLTNPPPRKRVFRVPDRSKLTSIGHYSHIEVVDDTPRGDVFLKLFGIHVGQFHDTVEITKVPSHAQEKDGDGNKSPPKEPPELKDGDTIRFPGSMTTVAPAWQIERLLQEPHLSIQRDDRKKAEITAEQNDPKRRAVVPERVVRAEPADANPAHKEDFIAVLGEAAQAPSKGD